MASILLILLCSTVNIQVSSESDADENEGKYNILVEKMQLERNVRIAKRSISRVNEIGGSNDNGVVVANTETNLIHYSDPGSDVTHKVNVKPITTTTDGSEIQKVKNSSDSGVKNDSLVVNNNVTGKSIEGKQVTDINNTSNLNNTVNRRHKSAAIPKIAVFSSNNTGTILNAHSEPTSQNQSKTETGDFVTPVIVTRQNAHKLSTSDVTNLITGNNLNTTPVNQANKNDNEIPQVTTERQDHNSVVKTSSNSIKFTTLKTTFQTKNQSAMDITLPTTFQTQIGSYSNHGDQSPTQSSNESHPGNSSDQFKVVPDVDKPSNKSFTENDGPVADSSTKMQTTASLRTKPESTIHTDIVKTNYMYNASEESASEGEMSADPEFSNSTSSDMPESEPESQAEPIQELENISVSTNTVTNHKVNATNVVPKSLVTTVSYKINSSAEHDNVHTTKSPENTTNISNNFSNTLVNETVKDRSLKPVEETSSIVTETIPVTSNVVASVESDKIKFTTKYFTAIEKNETAEQQEKTSMEPSSTIVNSILTETTTVKPEGQVSAEPEESVTQEPEVKITTDSYAEPDAENTTGISSSTIIYPAIFTGTKMSMPPPEPSGISNTTVHPARSGSKTTAQQETVEPTSVPENSRPTKQIHIDSTTESTPYPVEETEDKKDNGDETDVEPEVQDDYPEPEKEYQPELDTDQDQLNTDAFAEPGPDWKLAKAFWKEAWEFHVYFFGIAFALLGVYCLLTLIKLWNMEHILSKHYFITLHLLVILVCTLRSTYLMVDAYNSLGTFPFGVDYFLYSTAFPCLTALFSILFYALLLATRVQVISKKAQKLWVLVLIITLHFILSIATDIIVGLFTSASVMIIICQAFFILWGLLMFIGYLVIFRQLYKGAIIRIKAMMSSHYQHKYSVVHPQSKQIYTLCLAVKITFISAFFGVAIAGFELYGMFGVYGILKSNAKPDPWPWWTYHTIVRTLEIFMCLTIAYVASQPLRYSMKKNMDRRIYHFLLPCSICCCPDKLDQSGRYTMYGSSVSMDYVTSETDHLSWLKKLKSKKTSSPQAPYPPHTAEKYADPDATLLVRKVKRSSQPSMLVVEDGFVRIRREDEILPSNQYELESGSSLSSDTNIRQDVQCTRATANVMNWTNIEETVSFNKSETETSVNFDNYILKENETSNRYTNNGESADETDIDIVVTESENEDNHEPQETEGSVVSNNSLNMFRPLSMIDLATSIESELERAFNSSCVEETDIISGNNLPVSGNSLPVSFRDTATDWNDCAFYEYHPDNRDAGVAFNLDSTHYSSDSADDQSKSSAACLLRPPVRRCKSDESKACSPKYKHFEKNKYFSVSGVDSIGNSDEGNTHFGSNGELRTEL